MALKDGHINKNWLIDIQTLARGVDHFNEKDNIWCTPCIEGKQHRIKYPKEGAFISTWMFKLIDFCKQTCMDVVGNL
jgi:hypothetical protein